MFDKLRQQGHFKTKVDAHGNGEMKLNPSATPDPVPKIKNIETEGL